MGAAPIGGDTLPTDQQPIHSRLVVSDQQAPAHVEDGHPIRRDSEARGQKSRKNLADAVAKVC